MVIGLGVGVGVGVGLRSGLGFDRAAHRVEVGVAVVGPLEPLVPVTVVLAVDDLGQHAAW